MALLTILGRGATVQGFQPIARTRPLVHKALYASSSSKSKSKSNSQATPLPSSPIQWSNRQKCFRPTIQDVERISWGKPAKQKGTGSRGVPHRLNESERLLFDQARRKGFLEVTGSGWRSQRSDAPLINSYRSLCDARGQACIVVHKGNTGSDDEVVVDLSPLRLPNLFGGVESDMVGFVDLPTSYSPKMEEEGDEDGGDDEIDIDATVVDADDDSWDSRPIYQLPTYCISWELQRSEAKGLGKKLAAEFDTIETKASKSKKPNHVKHGKNRRSGGYGIG
eukprot:CAMPEP_0197236548 /NCGR_PEP_ID=MMETSP1429-20130617/3611_1 /TAXON_ID=49237 /ORGANISM="Chaetoceros  sp., Strain UNC1202" /LENGTH=279 /DNA_ID=CAMNT_0042695343 /DNA_START=135 /DNA_END=974 /DNA_ORIENTATION=-